MARAIHRSIIAAVAGMALLAGCEEGVNPFTGKPITKNATEAATEGGPAAASTVEKDVESPDVFAANEAGLWDGRPSLGGVWIAHPDVKDPERVLIKNEANGTSVVGALFRRERNNPGPRIQVSSDAAEALGMLAGQPTVLNVVALRREEIEIPAPIQEPAGAEAAEPSQAPADPEVIAPAEEKTAAKAPKKKPSNPVEMAEAAIVAATSAPIETMIKPGRAEAAKAGSVEVAPLEPPKAMPVPAAAASTAPAPAPASKSSGVSKPYIQIGIFSVEENAENTATSLRNVGVIPMVRAQESKGSPFWRVLVGPANTESEQQALLTKVRELGFEDAYYVTN